jgi:hypothetical protein
MKRLFSFVIIALLAVGLGGTALAATSVELSTATSGVSTVYWGAVFGAAPGGTSAYISTGGIANDPTKGDAGTTLYAVSNNLTNATGTELRAVALQFDSGATPLGGPQLISGTSDAVVLLVQAAATSLAPGSTTDSGATLYVIDGGTGAVNWALSLPGSGLGVAAPAAGTGIYDLANAGTVPYSLAPVTIDNESLATAGATIYGIVSSGAASPGGASIFAVSSVTPAFNTNVNGRSNVTGLSLPSIGYLSAVSAVHTAPVISGESLFVVGYSALGTGGNTILQFAKNNIYDGPSGATTVGLNADLSDQWIPTPTVGGNSIFVVDNNGAVSAYAIPNLALQYSVDYAGNSFNGGVTAGPVHNGTYIVLCATSSLTGYQINNLSGNSKEWTYDFGASSRYTIDSTPVISGGYVWVTVTETIGNSTTSTIWRFTISDTYDGSPLIVANLRQTLASPIVVGNSIWTTSYDPLVEKIVAGGAAGENYWPQFKFNKAKTGNNTADEDDVVPGSGGGCFISTIK